MNLSFWLFAAVPPFLVALGATVLLRHWGGRKLGFRLAELAPVLGFLVGFIGVVRGVPFLNMIAHRRVGETAVLALAAGLGLALLPPGPRLGRYGAVGAALLAVYWQVPGGQIPAEDMLIAAGAALAAVLILDRLVDLARTGAAAPLVLAIAAAGLTVIAFSARAGLLGGLALALAAGSVGWLAWNRPFDKARLSLAAALSGGMVFVAVAFAVVQNAARPAWTLAPLLACFWAETILRHLPLPARRTKKKARPPLALAAAAALPAAAAAALSVALP
jgi:hypothetical protein